MKCMLSELRGIVIFKIQFNEVCFFEGIDLRIGQYQTLDMIGISFRIY